MTRLTDEYGTPPKVCRFEPLTGTALAIDWVIFNWHLAGWQQLVSANDEGPDPEPRAA